jgi:hypothetical protein
MRDRLLIIALILAIFDVFVSFSMTFRLDKLRQSNSEFSMSLQPETASFAAALGHPAEMAVPVK